MQHPAPTTVDSLDTPCLVADLDAMDRNIRRMVEYCHNHNVAWRPHAKSYKSSVIARRVVDAGAIGVTCAKLGEAEVMAGVGIRDILIANPLVGRTKLNRLAALMQRADPIVVVDHEDQIKGLSDGLAHSASPLRVLVEVDIGMQRCGVLPGSPAVELAHRVAAARSLRFTGIMGWEGHLVAVADTGEKSRQIAESVALLRDTREALEKAGLSCPIVSAGGTGSYQVTARLGVATEIQAGGGIFMDLFYRNKCQVAGLEFALSILATITSRPTNDRAVMDAGRKTMNQELVVPEVIGRSDLRVRSLSAEHGVLDVIEPPGPAIGDRISLLPGYGDFTTVLHDRIFAARAGRIEAVWPLDARGRLD